MHIKKENHIFVLDGTKKLMNLDDLHGNSAVPVIFLIFFTDIMVITKL